MKNRWKIIAAGVIAVFALGAGSCDEKGLGDAPVGTQIEDERTVIVNIDTFPNFAVFCDGTTAVYSTTREAAAMTVESSTLCDGSGIEANQVDEGRETDVPEGETISGG